MHSRKLFSLVQEKQGKKDKQHAVGRSTLFGTRYGIMIDPSFDLIELWFRHVGREYDK